jgi:hypothetical protein
MSVTHGKTGFPKSGSPVFFYGQNKEPDSPINKNVTWNDKKTLCPAAVGSQGNAGK